MFKIVQKDEKGFVLKKGEMVDIVCEGIYFFKNMEVLNIYKNFGYLENEKIDILYKNNKEIVEKNFYVFELGDYEVGIVYREGKVIDFVNSGKTYFYMKGKFKIEVKKINLSISPQIPEEFLKDFVLLKEKYGRLEYIEDKMISNNQKGILTVNGKINSLLNPGKYMFFTKFDNVKVSLFETAKNKLEISGQELLTKDKYNLRINLTVFFSIIDVVKYFENYGEGFEFLYAEGQFALRQIVANYTLDELLEKKENIGVEIQEYISKKLQKESVFIENVGIKDIILPGEMREIMNQVIQAEKTSQVNAIKRRDEVANVRNMLNTAKLYEENPMLLRLKEIDTLEKVVEKIKNLNVNNGFEGLLDLVKVRK